MGVPLAADLYVWGQGWQRRGVTGRQRETGDWGNRPSLPLQSTARRLPAGSHVGRDVRAR